MIDSSLGLFIEESERFYPAGAARRSVVEQRRLYDAYAAAFAVARPRSVRSCDGMLTLSDRSIQLRLYRDTSRVRVEGVILYSHGGGFVLGSLDSHDGIVARIAAGTGADVVAIDYRLAPEHHAPAALDDVCGVIAAALDGDLPWADVATGRLAVMGDSAGATLMASAALRIGQQRPGALAAMALVYPALGFEPEEPSRTVEADAPMLTLADAHAYRDAYLGGRAVPLGTFVLDEPDLAALPPTVLLPAEHDPLRDDCTALARRLRATGTNVMLLPGTGLVHGCLRALDRSPLVSAPFGIALRFLREHLTTDEAQS